MVTLTGTGWRREQVELHDLPIIIKRVCRFNKGVGRHGAVETTALSRSLFVLVVREPLDALLQRAPRRLLVREQCKRQPAAPAERRHGGARPI